MKRVANLNGRIKTGGTYKLQKAIVEAMEHRRLLSAQGVVFNDIYGGTTYSAGETPLIGRTVYADLNNNGILDVGEPSTVTDSTGHYSLSVSVDSVIRSIAPAGWVTVGAPVTAPGGLVPEVDLGQVVPMTLSGTDFVDNNLSGTNDSGDAPLAGATVYEDLNSNGQLDPGEPAAITAANGTYTLAVVPRPTYSPSVTFVAPAGYIAEQRTINFAFYSGQLLQISAGFATQSFIHVYTSESRSGVSYSLPNATVFVDVNNDGILDAGDVVGTSGLYGNVLLGGLPQGTFNVYIVPPNGDSPVPGSGSAQVTIGSLTSSSAFLQVQPSSTVGSISGTVFLDRNVNGQYDSNDWPLQSQTVYLDLNSDGVLDNNEPTAISAANGSFTFSNLAPGSYTIRFASNTTGQYLQTDPAQNGGQTVNVSAGLTTTGVLFGLHDTTSYVSVSGQVFNDLNNNGTIDSSDNPLAGVTVYIDANNDGVLDTGDISTTTGAGGLYTLNDYLPGTLVIRVVPPTGDAQVVPANSAPITVSIPTLGTGLLSQNFAVVSTLPTIGGIVFSDLNATGSASPLSNESGISGVTVFDDLNGNGVPDPGEPSAVSNTSGYYQLFNVSSGTSSIREVVPAGYYATDAGGGVQTVTAPASNVNFPLYKGMTIQGFIFGDENGNGVRDANEAGLAGVRVYIDNNEDRIWESNEQSTLTDASGLFTLSDIAPGPSSLQRAVSFAVQAPTGYRTNFAVSTFGSTFGGSYSTTIPVTNVPNVTGVVNFLLTPESSTGQPGVTVFDDLNGNGLLDPGEPTAVTNALSSYTMAVPAGNNTIVMIVPPGESAVGGVTSRTVNASAQNLSSAWFALSPNSTSTFVPGALGGTVFEDTNQNGMQDLGEPPIPNQQVYIDVNNDGVYDNGDISTTTDSAGQYQFNNLPAGTYFVRQVLPSGATQTRPANGAAAIYFLSANGNTVWSENSSLGVVGEVGTITGNVFSDTNGNGAQDNGEQNLPGAEVYLDTNNNGVYDIGEPVTYTTANGFTFTNLSAGTYYVRQVLSPGNQQTSPARNGAALVLLPIGGTASVSLGTNIPVPTPVITGASSVAEGSTVALSAASSTEVGGQIVKYEWDTNYNGSVFDPVVTGATLSFNAALLDGPSSTVIALRVTDAAGNTAITTQTELVTNVAPTALFSGSQITMGSTGTVGFTNPFDPSVFDTAAGFTYSYDFNNDGTYDLVTSSPTATVPASYLTTAGAHTIGGKITDKDGGFTTYTATVQVNNSTSKLAGTVIGTSGSYKNDGNTIAKAFDGNLSTFFDGPNASGNWVGLDLGSAKVITSLGYVSRSGWASRMNGGTFQASNSSTFASGTVNLYTIASNANPSSTSFTTQSIKNTAAYRYVRYVSPVNSYGDVAELEFFGTAPVTPVTPVKLTGTTIGTAGSYQNNGNTIAKATDGNLSTYFDGPTASGNWVGLDLGSAKTIKQISFAPRSGYSNRMVGGIFQASNSANFSSGVVNLYTVTAAPASGALTSVSVTDTVAYRYFRYLSPNNSNGDIAEVAFYG